MDIAYVKKHIPHVVFRELAGMDHGQYVLTCPSDFARDITAGEGTERSVGYCDGRSDDNMPVSQKTAKRFLTKDKRKTKQENSIWNFYAPIYNLFMRSNRKQYERMNRRIRKVIRNRRVLEVATGTGLIAKNVADAADIMIATDFAQKMLEEARKGFVPGNLTFQMEDATALSFEDNSFDVVIISNALHIIPDPQKALSEVARVLNPGGILIAPNFIHDNKSSKAMFWSKALTMAGIAFEAKWDENGYGKFLEGQGFRVKNYAVLPAMIPLMYTECQL